MKKTILIVEDEKDIAKLVAYNLKNAGFDTIVAPDGLDAIEKAKAHLPLLIILDILLPKLDGMEVCKFLKRDESTRNIPVIMLTAKGEEVDRIVGLELGADDYIVKPFSPRELVLRVKAILRRTNRGESAEQSDIIKISDMVIDPSKYELTVQNEKIDLTTTEFKLLLQLARNRGRVLTRSSLLDRVWGDDYVGLERTVDVHIRRLRAKLGNKADLIETVRGVGYRLKETGR